MIENKLRTKPAYVAHLVVIIAALTYMPIKHLFLSDGLSWSSKNEDNLPAAFLVLEKITKPGFQLNKAYTGCSVDYGSYDLSHWDKNGTQALNRQRFNFKMSIKK